MQSIPGVGARAFWLVLVPTSFAFIPWIVEATAPSSGMSTRTCVLEACSPLMGLCGVLAYWNVSRHPVRLWPYLPFAASATFVAVSLSTLATDSSQDAAIPLYPILFMFGQPFIALAGGVLSFVAVGRRGAGLTD